MFDLGIFHTERVENTRSSPLWYALSFNTYLPTIYLYSVILENAFSMIQIILS